MNRVNKKDFRKWLSGFSDRNIVGKVLDDRSCPIANFLTSKEEVLGARVTDHSYKLFFFSCANRIYILPKWAQEFVKRIDQVSTSNTMVSAKTARKILAQV